MSDGVKLVQQVFIEAAAHCGDDPLAVARYVADRVREMSPEDQKLFAGMAEGASADFAHDVPDKPH